MNITIILAMHCAYQANADCLSKAAYAVGLYVTGQPKAHVSMIFAYSIKKKKNLNLKNGSQ